MTTMMKYKTYFVELRKIASSFFLILYVSFQAERMLVQIESVHTVFFLCACQRCREDRFLKVMCKLYQCNQEGSGKLF